MRIFSEIVYQWSDRQERYILIRSKSRPFSGQIGLCKGASAAQNSLASSQANFYNTLQQDYGTQFKNQNAILGTLTNSLNPIVQGGPNQFGFSTGETNALNSQAIQGTGQQYNNAKQALGAQQAAEGGGNSLLPSGVQAQQQAGLASSAANQASSQLLGIQNEGYQQGHQNYESAIGQLGGVASAYNPSGTANSANSAGSSAFGSATTVNQENQAASPWNFFAPILGGAASNALGGLGAVASGGATFL